MHNEVLELLRDSHHGSHGTKLIPSSIVGTHIEPRLPSSVPGQICTSSPATPHMMDSQTSGGIVSEATVIGYQNPHLQLRSDNERSMIQAARYRCWSFNTRLSKISTWFGTIECSTSIKSRLGPKCFEAGYDTDENHAEEHLNRLSVRYEPAYWMVKCGINNVWYADISQLCATGWQQGIQTYTVSW